jgi:lysozyme family protein
VIGQSRLGLDSAIGVLLPHSFLLQGLFEDKRGVPSFEQFVEHEQQFPHPLANDDRSVRSQFSIPTSVASLAVVSSGTGNLAHRIPPLTAAGAAVIAAVAAAFDLAVHE